MPQFNAALVQVVGKPGEMRLVLEGPIVDPDWLFAHLGAELVVDLVEAQQSLPLEFDSGEPVSRRARH